METETHTQRSSSHWLPTVRAASSQSWKPETKSRFPRRQGSKSSRRHLLLPSVHVGMQMDWECSWDWACAPTLWSFCALCSCSGQDCPLKTKAWVPSCSFLLVQGLRSLWCCRWGTGLAGPFCPPVRTAAGSEPVRSPLVLWLALSISMDTVVAHYGQYHPGSRGQGVAGPVGGQF